MKGLLKGMAALGVVAALGATSAQAQGTRITAGVGGGIAIPLGSYSDFTKTGWDVTGAVQFKPASSPVGFQIDGTYQENKFDPSSAGKDQWIYGTGNIVYWLPVSEETKIRPYLLGGGGVYHVKAKPTVGTSSSVTKFGLNAGAGFDLDFQNNIGLFIEGRFHNVFVQGSDAKFIPINVGLRFHTK
jgi:opacity protein-like surface antigen